MWSGATEFDREMGAIVMLDTERLQLIHTALKERGYAPVNQIVGFLLTGDPTYITNHNGARSLAGRINRTDLLAEILSYYLAGHEAMASGAAETNDAYNSAETGQTTSINLNDILGKVAGSS